MTDRSGLALAALAILINAAIYAGLYAGLIAIDPEQTMPALVSRLNLVFWIASSSAHLWYFRRTDHRWLKAITLAVSLSLNYFVAIAVAMLTGNLDL